MSTTLTHEKARFGKLVSNIDISKLNDTQRANLLEAATEIDSLFKAGMNAHSASILLDDFEENFVGGNYSSSALDQLKQRIEQSYGGTQDSAPAPAPTGSSAVPPPSVPPAAQAAPAQPPAPVPSPAPVSDGTTPDWVGALQDISKSRLDPMEKAINRHTGEIVALQGEVKDVKNDVAKLNRRLGDGQPNYAAGAAIGFALIVIGVLLNVFVFKFDAFAAIIVTTVASAAVAALFAMALAKKPANETDSAESQN